jgi:hypothetical protein
MQVLSSAPSELVRGSTVSNITKWVRWIALLGVPRRSPRPLRVGIVIAMAIGAGTIATSSAIHLHLWLTGYRHVPRIGPLFLAQSISGFVLAIALVTYRRMVAVLAGMVFQAASAVGLLLSATVGFLGIHDGLDVPWATTSIVVELMGFSILAGCAVAMMLSHGATGSVQAIDAAGGCSGARRTRGAPTGTSRARTTSQ